MFKVAVFVAMVVFVGQVSASPVHPKTEELQVREFDSVRDSHGVNASGLGDASSLNKKVEADSGAWNKKAAAAAPVPGAWQYLLHLLEDERDHLLKVDAAVNAQRASSADVSAVPLPTAFWLFGSALFGFVSLSNRRKV